MKIYETPDMKVSEFKQDDSIMAKTVLSGLNNAQTADTAGKFTLTFKS